MKILISLALILVTINGYSHTLIISDIDDTIKVSHVLSTAGKVSRAADVTTPFTGMAQLYQMVLNQDPAHSQIVYLSNAPKEIAGIPALRVSHTYFLQYNGFPAGDLDLRDDIFDQNHKIDEIRRLLKAEKPDLVILVGDNGERDIEIYQQAASEFSAEIKMVTFIHQMYSVHVPFYLPNFMAEIGKAPAKGQIGFVTPIEIAVELKRQNLLDQKSYLWLIQNLSPYIANEDSFKWDGLKPISFPSFKNCRDFVWKWNVTPELVPVYQKIMKSCR